MTGCSAPSDDPTSALLLPSRPSSPSTASSSRSTITSTADLREDLGLAGRPRTPSAHCHTPRRTLRLFQQTFEEGVLDRRLPGNGNGNAPELVRHRGNIWPVAATGAVLSIGLVGLVATATIMVSGRHGSSVASRLETVDFADHGHAHSVADVPHATCGTTEVGADYVVPRSAWHRHIDHVANAGRCCSLCAYFPRCKSWTWVKDAKLPTGNPGQCWLKGALPGQKVHKVDIVSGLSPNVRNPPVVLPGELGTSAQPHPKTGLEQLPPQHCSTVEQNIDYVDDPSASKRHVDHVPNPGKCCAVCSHFPQCRSWTWVKDAKLPTGNPGQCWLKSALPQQRVAKVGIVSGFRAGTDAANNASSVLPHAPEPHATIQEGATSGHAIVPPGTAAKAACSILENNVNYDIESSWEQHVDHVVSPQHCCNICGKFPQCKAWTWVKDAKHKVGGQCWMRGDFPLRRTRRWGVVSGLAPNNSMKPLPLSTLAPLVTHATSAPKHPVSESSTTGRSLTHTTTTENSGPLLAWPIYKEAGTTGSTTEGLRGQQQPAAGAEAAVPPAPAGAVVPASTRGQQTADGAVQGEAANHENKVDTAAGLPSAAATVKGGPQVAQRSPPAQAVPLATHPGASSKVPAASSPPLPSATPGTITPAIIPAPSPAVASVATNNLPDTDPRAAEQRAKAASVAAATLPTPSATGPVQTAADGAATPEEVTFYMYRASNEASFPLESVNAADLSGVLWYLHREVVVSTPRKYGIDRIRRFKVTMRNTQEFFNVHHRTFGAFLAFDASKCTSPLCGSVFAQYGFIVGCQVIDPSVAAYRAANLAVKPANCRDGQCNLPVWYSLPGPCPLQALRVDEKGADRTYKTKPADCVQKMPGGRCPHATGAADCTYSVSDAGFVPLNELVGIRNYTYWWQHLHHKEYVARLDRGVGTHFWDDKHGVDSCAKRVEAVQQLFKKRYPNHPESLPEPPCDFDMYYEGEFQWPVNHTGTEDSTFWKKGE